MSMIFAMLVAVFATTALATLGLAFSMIANRNKALAEQVRNAQGSLENIRQGQMLAPDDLPGHMICGGMAWDENNKQHTRQSAPSMEAVKGIYLAR